MTNAPLFPDIFIDEIKIPHESTRSKYVFSVYLEHDANISRKELAEITGYSKSSIDNYFRKYNYRERADIFLSHKIKSRAEYGIHQGSTFDASNFEMANVNLGLQRKMLQHILNNFQEFLNTVPITDIWKYFKELHYLQKVNIENGHTSSESLINSLQFIVKKQEKGDITDKQAQELMRELFEEWFNPDEKEDTEETE